MGSGNPANSKIIPPTLSTDSTQKPKKLLEESHSNPPGSGEQLAPLCGTRSTLSLLDQKSENCTSLSHPCQTVKLAFWHNQPALENAKNVPNLAFGMPIFFFMFCFVNGSMNATWQNIGIFHDSTEFPGWVPHFQECLKKMFSTPPSRNRTGYSIPSSANRQPRPFLDSTPKRQR